MAGAGLKITPKNYRANQRKSLVWDSATVVPISGGDAVVVPVVYNNDLFVSSWAKPALAYRLVDLTEKNYRAIGSALFEDYRRKALGTRRRTHEPDRLYRQAITAGRV